MLPPCLFFQCSSDSDTGVGITHIRLLRSKVAVAREEKKEETNIERCDEFK